MLAFVNQSAALEVNGIPVSISEGDAWDAGDPVVKAYPAFFSDEPKFVKRSVAKTEAKKPTKK